MTKALLRNFWMNSILEQLSGVRVSRVMEPDTRQVLKPRLQNGELMSEAARLQRLTVGAGAYECLAALPNT